MHCWWAALLLLASLSVLVDGEHDSVVSLDEGASTQATKGMAAQNFDDITHHLRHRPMLAQILPQLLISMTLKLTDDHKAEVTKMTDQIQTMLAQKEVEDQSQHRASHGACKEALTQADTLVAKFDKEAKRARLQLRDLVRDVGTQNGEASRSRHRAATTEHAIANASAIRFELMSKMEGREDARHTVLATIAEISSTACLQSAFRASTQCGTVNVTTGAGAPNRTVTGEYGTAAAGTQCKLPFSKGGVTYEDCAGHSHGGHGWCCMDSDCSSGIWGSCAATELTNQEIAGEAARSKAVEPQIAQAYALEQSSQEGNNARWQLREGQLGEGLTEQASAIVPLSDGWPAVQTGKSRAIALGAVISTGAAAAGQEALEQLLALKQDVSAESGQDLASWFETDEMFQADIRKREDAVQAEERLQLTLVGKVSVLELQLKKQREALAAVREQLTRAERAAGKARLRCWQDDQSYNGRVRDRGVDETVLDRLRTQFTQGTVDCAGGCNSPEQGFCAHRGKTATTYCACRRGFYGAKCELHQCPGLSVPANEIKEEWKPTGGVQSELFPAHHPLACSGHGACDKATGRCGKCVSTAKLCRHANSRPGAAAVEIPGLRPAGKLQLQDAEVLCAEDEQCLGFSFSGQAGYWDADGVLQSGLYDPETKTSVVTFYSSLDMEDLGPQEWGAEVYVKTEGSCPSVKMCRQQQRHVGDNATKVAGMKQGNYFTLERAQKDCLAHPSCGAFTFPAAEGYFDKAGVQHTLYSAQTQKGVVSFYSYPAIRALEPKEDGMSVYTVCGPGTWWLPNEPSWISENKKQRNPAGAVSGNCSWDFEGADLKRWNVPSDLMCTGAFFGQPAGKDSCGADRQTTLMLSEIKVNDVVQSDGAPYKQFDAGLRIGTALFTDRPWKVRSITGPEERTAQLFDLAGVRVPDADKVDERTITISAGQPVKVILLVDEGYDYATAGDLPAWMGGEFERWNDTAVSVDDISVSIHGRRKMIPFVGIGTQLDGEVTVGPIPATSELAITGLTCTREERKKEEERKEEERRKKEQQNQRRRGGGNTRRRRRRGNRRLLSFGEAQSSTAGGGRRRRAAVVVRASMCGQVLEGGLQAGAKPFSDDDSLLFGTLPSGVLEEGLKGAALIQAPSTGEADNEIEFTVNEPVYIYVLVDSEAFDGERTRAPVWIEAAGLHEYRRLDGVRIPISDGSEGSRHFAVFRSTIPHSGDITLGSIWSESDSGDEALLGEAQSSTGRACEVDPIGAQLGEKVFIDQPYTFRSIPWQLSSHQLIRTSDADKADDNTVSFSTKVPVDVYLGVDEQSLIGQPLPAGFKQTDMSISVAGHPSGDLVLSVLKSTSPRKGSVKISQLPRAVALSISNMSSSTTAGAPILSTLQAGNKLYTDSPEVLKHFPKSLHLGGLPAVILPNGARQSAHTLNFHLSQPSKLFLMLSIGASDVDGGGWELVRRAPAAGQWHNVSDKLGGSLVYGAAPQSDTSSQSFSVQFEDRDFDQILVSSNGVWAILRRDELAAGRAAVASTSCSNSVVISRSGDALAVICNSAATGNLTLYSEGTAADAGTLTDGANVYIRRAPKQAAAAASPDVISSFDVATSTNVNWTLQGDIHLSHQWLVLKGGIAQSLPTLSDVVEKTLEVWLRPTEIDQDGAAIAIQSHNGAINDAIHFRNRVWLASSNQHVKSNPEVVGSEETQPTVLHLVVTYAADGTVTMYRNGAVYRNPFKTAGGSVAFAKGARLVVGGINNRFLGFVYRAVLHSRELTHKQVLSSYRAGVPLPGGPVPSWLSQDFQQAVDQNGAELSVHTNSTVYRVLESKQLQQGNVSFDIPQLTLQSLKDKVTEFSERTKHSMARLLQLQKEATQIAANVSHYTGEMDSAHNTTNVLRDTLMLRMSQFASAACSAVRTEAALDQAKQKSLIAAAYRDFAQNHLANMDAVQAASQALTSSEEQMTQLSQSTGGAAAGGMADIFSSISSNRRLLHQKSRDTVIHEVAERKVAFKLAAEKAATGIAVFKEWAHGKAKSYAAQEKKLRVKRSRAAGALKNETSSLLEAVKSFKSNQSVMAVSRARVNEANYQASYTAGMAAAAGQDELGEGLQGSASSTAGARAAATTRASAKLARVLTKERAHLQSAHGNQHGALIEMLSARGAVGKARVTSAMLGESVTQMSNVKHLLAHVVKTSESVQDHQSVSPRNLALAKTEADDATALELKSQEKLERALANHMSKSTALHRAKRQQVTAQTAVSKCLQEQDLVDEVWRAHLLRESKLFHAQGRVGEKQRMTTNLQRHTRAASGQQLQMLANTAQPVVAVRPILGAGLVAFAKESIPAQLIALKSTLVNTVVLLKPSVCDETTMQGNYFLRSDFVASDVAHGHSPRGVIQSPPFVVGSNASLSFLVAGGSHQWIGGDQISSLTCDDSLHEGITAVTLERAAGSSWQKLMSASGNNSASFIRVDWDLTPWSGETLRLRAYDLAEGKWGYIALDDVQVSGCVTLPEDGSQAVLLENPATNTLDARDSALGGANFTVNSNAMMLVYDLGGAYHIDRFRALGGSSLQMNELSWAKSVEGPWTTAVAGLSIGTGQWAVTDTFSVQNAQYWRFSANSTQEQPECYFSMAGNGNNKHPSECSPTDSKLAVRCCQDGKGIHTKEYRCNKDKTYAEAGSICKNKGYRLCSADEIKAGKSKGMGCGYDGERVWTSSSELVSVDSHASLSEVQFHGTSDNLESAVDSYVHYPTKEISGKAIWTGDVTRERCAALCTARAQCLSFNYASAIAHCSLNSADQVSEPAAFQESDQDYYEKQPVAWRSGSMQACEERQCPLDGKCSGRGKCELSTGECQCQSDSYGSRCQFRKCPGGNPKIVFERSNPEVCAGRGRCNRRSGKCTCVSQFEGDGCEKKKCPNQCSGVKQGKCNEQDGRCSCVEGFHGKACNLRSCPKGCNGNGQCDTVTGKCVCASGFSGNACAPDKPCKSVVANWWTSFNSEGWSSCPGSSLLTGLYIGAQPCQGLYCIEMARCSVPCEGNAVRNIGACYHADWSSSMAQKGWSKCDTNYFVQGLYRSECQSLYCLNLAKCCQVQGAEWNDCSNANWANVMSREGWAHASGTALLTGFFRSSSGATNGISDLQSASQCGFRKKPLRVVCGDGKREDDEKCDDNNQEDGDGCSSQCIVENGWRCRELNTPLEVTNIESTSSDQPEVLAGGLGAGKQYYTDEAYTIDSTPVLGGEFTISTSDAEKSAQRTMTFTTSDFVRVYVLVDSKAVDTAWLDSRYTRTKHTIPVAGRGEPAHFVVYRSKHVHKGPVTVGPAPALTEGTNHIVVLQRSACSEVVPYRKGSAKLVGRFSYNELENQLTAGTQICGAGFHVCNFQEVTVNGVIHGEDLSGGSGWIVGNFDTSEENRRSMWSGGDSTQCRRWSAAQWRGRWGPYTGRVHCTYKGHKAAAACCSDTPDRTEAAVKLAQPARSYWDLNTELDRDWQGRGVCGDTWHVCNYPEVTAYGAMLGHTFHDAKQAWIVGGFSNWEKNRRSIWNGQDSTFCHSGRFPAWWNKFKGYHGTVHCFGGEHLFPVACCKDRLALPAARHAKTVKLVGHLSFNSLSHQLNRDWRGARSCGPEWHVCNYQEVLAYGGYQQATLGEHAWIVGGFSDWERHRRSIWNGQDSEQCKQGRAPLWLAGKWGPYSANVHCVGTSHKAPVACCRNAGFPTATTGELNIAKYATVTTTSGSAGAALVNGDDSTGWIVSDGVGQSAVFDFGGAIEIIKIVVFNHNTADKTDVKTLSIHVSDDNAAWRLVEHHDLQDTVGASPNPPQEIHAVDAARFWRFTISSVHDNTETETGLAEVQLFQQGAETDLALFAKHEGYSLLPDVYSTLAGMGPLQCSGSCSADKECKSFSYNTAENQCELSSSNRNGGSTPDADTDYDYYEKVVDTHSSGYCKADMTDYRGLVSVTSSGRTCQSWSVQLPHPHEFTPERHPGRGLGEHNYCRNPDDEEGAWCYTEDSTQRWELCTIPRNPECAVTYSDNIAGGGGKHSRTPALSIYSEEGSVSATVESLNAAAAMEVCACGVGVSLSSCPQVYIELRNQQADVAWGIGMNDDLDLLFCYGRLGTMNKDRCALRIEPSGKLHVLGYATFHEEVKLDSDSSELLGESQASSPSAAAPSEHLPLLLGEATNSESRSEKQVGGSGRQEPAAAWFSDDNDCSIRLESAAGETADNDVYWELRNQKLDDSWGIGMASGTALALGYGPLGSLSGKTLSLEVATDKQVTFHQEVVFHRRPDFSGGSALKVGSTVALKGGRYNGRYFCTDHGDKIKCSSSTMNAEENFKVVDGGNGRIALRGGKNSQLCADESSTIKCDRSAVGSWEQFQVVNSDNGRIALRGGNSGKFCADEYNSVKCNRNRVGSWEKFTVHCVDNCGLVSLDQLQQPAVLGESTQSVSVPDHWPDSDPEPRIEDVNQRTPSNLADPAPPTHQKIVHEQLPHAPANTAQATGTRTNSTVELSSGQHDLEIAWAKAEQMKLSKQEQESSLEQAWLKAEKSGKSGSNLQAAWLQAELMHAQAKPVQSEAEMEKAWLNAEHSEALGTADEFKLGSSMLRGAARRMLATEEPKQETRAQKPLEPAVEFYSTDDDVSIRVESRRSSKPAQVYLEFGKSEPNKQLEDSWKVGMRDNQALVIGWGRAGTMDGMNDAIRLRESGSIEVLGRASFKGGVSSAYTSASGLQCIGGQAVSGGRNQWSQWSTCPAGYSVVGLGEVHLDVTKLSGGTTMRFQEVDHHQCDDRGCRAYCWGTGCSVTARCCKSIDAAMKCYNAPYRTQQKYRWGNPSYCGKLDTATGFAKLDLHNSRWHGHKMVNDFLCSGRYCRSWCWGANCGVRARCCSPENDGLKLECQAGAQAYGDKDRWGPYSQCAVGYMAVSTRRIDMLDHVHPNKENIAKQQCNDAGCRSYCWGSACNTWAQCCRIAPR